MTAKYGKVSLLTMGIPPPIEVANVGVADSLILMVMALVVFGPRKLPQIGRQIGKLMYEFRKASNDFKFQMEEELRNAEDADRRKQEEERQRALTLAAPPQPVLTIEATAGTASQVESPYAGESVYPPVIAPAVEDAPEETYPRILPPSTGEQVPAARPWNLEEELSKTSGVPAGETAAETTPAAMVETPPKPADETTPEAHHA